MSAHFTFRARVAATLLVLSVIPTAACSARSEASTSGESDVVGAQDKAYIDMFCDTYDACRDQFRQTAQGAAAGIAGAKVWNAALPSADPDLTMDFAFFPATDPAATKKLLLMTSGIHGLEGYTGSTLQAVFMLDMLKQTLDSGVSVLFAHGLNAWGMKYGSRYTEHRVDLNRNWFIADTWPGAQPDELYDGYNAMFNPQTPATFGNADFTGFVATQLLPNIRSIESGKLTQAAGQGQYRYPNGIEFGGQDYEPNRDVFMAGVSPYFDQFPETFHLDLHTGLGDRTMQLLPNEAHRQEISRMRNSIFDQNGYPIQSTGGSTFYSSFGDFSDFVCDGIYVNHPGHQCVNMLIEYGTLMETYWNQYPTAFRLFTQSKAQAFTLYLTVRENQLRREGGSARTPEEGTDLLSNYHDLFYPSDSPWRTMVLSESLTAWPKFIATFAGLQAPF